jgi:lipopolysaccharide transport system permease protein
MKKQNNLDKWDTVISPKRDLIYFNFREIFKYRDLIFLFIKRDFVTFYKQTILGPLWYIIQPLINAIVFTIIFGNLAKIPTEGVPPFIFYLAGNIIWGYFAICLNSTSNTFVRNSDIFGKVYFPRITIPISNIFIGMLQFFVQFIVFVCFLIYFYFSGSSINIDFTLIFIPLLLFQVAITGLGFGLMISSLTSKYRDLTFVMSFGVQLWMYATPIVYPLSLVSEKYRILFCLNPMTSVVESFRYIFFKESVIKLEYIFISIFISILVLILGMIFFNKTEKSFLDTV